MKNLCYEDYWGHYANIVLSDGKVCHGYIFGGTSALDAEDGIPSIDVRDKRSYGNEHYSWRSYYEDEIDHIELLD
mgnify:FL=1